MELYKALGIPKNADSKDIKKAYFTLAREHHPDKGGDAEEFKKVQHAYDVLSDSEKRSFYDQTGQVPGEGGSGPGPGQGMPFDMGGIFNMFGGGGGMPFGGMPFGGMPFGGGQPNKRGMPRTGKAPHKVHELNIKLENFYNGHKIQMKFERKRFCTECKGEGYTNRTSCDECGGRGQVNMQMMLGPGMIVQTTGPCNKCTGTGMKPGPPCKGCSGKCFIDQDKVLDIVIEPGMKPGERIIFPGECSDQLEYAEPGDVHLVLREAEEETTWSRDGDSLRANLGLNLKDSLLGSSHVLLGHPGFPDGFNVSVLPGSIHQSVVVVTNGGFPIKGTGKKGAAIITLVVKVEPSELKAVQENLELLKKIFANES